MVPVRLRLPLMLLGAAALMLAMWSGLVRLGWGLPPLRPGLPGAHGALMVGGFLGTLIGLERAVALRRRWAYVAPLLSGLGGVALIAGLPSPAGPLLLTLGSLGLVAVYAAVLRMQMELFTLTMALGALLWLSGNVLWLFDLPIFQVALWWMGFLILTIAGERLELSRMLQLPQWSREMFASVLTLVLAGLILSLWEQGAGVRTYGVGLIGLSLWLARHDIARRTILRKGLTRYIAACLIFGYVWLMVAGIIGVSFGGVPGGPRYDALLHTVLLGFVFSMIFGHAPIILPAITGVAVPYRQAFYAQLALLHISLAIRVGGDLLDWLPGRQWGGLLNVAALLLFFGTTILAVVSSRLAARAAKARELAHARARGRHVSARHTTIKAIEE